MLCINIQSGSFKTFFIYFCTAGGVRQRTARRHVVRVWVEHRVRLSRHREAGTTVSGCTPRLLTLLGLQSRFGDKPLKL